MSRILSERFFNRPTLAVARSLLGKYLVRPVGRRTITAMIVEVEAYDGPHDKASHASRGKTARNAVMFGPAGYWYVYFTYGMHWMLNIVTGKEGYPAAILIRGVATNADERGLTRTINGPARVTKFFKINKRFNGKPTTRKTGLWIEDRGVRIRTGHIAKSKRVGVEYAGPVWANKRFRLYVKE